MTDAAVASKPKPRFTPIVQRDAERMKQIEVRNALHQAIGVVQKLYDLTGQPDLKTIIDRAHSALDA